MDYILKSQLIYMVWTVFKYFLFVFVVVFSLNIMATQSEDSHHSNPLPMTICGYILFIPIIEFLLIIFSIEWREWRQIFIWDSLIFLTQNSSSTFLRSLKAFINVAVFWADSTEGIPLTFLKFSSSGWAIT